MFTAVLFTVVEERKYPKCPVTDDCIEKLQDISFMEYYSEIKMSMILDKNGLNWR